MAIPDFYNVNLGRTYPLMYRSGQLPADHAIVDAAFTVTSDTKYDPLLHDVLLTDIGWIDDRTLYVVFICTAPWLASSSMQFHVPTDSKEFSAFYVQWGDNGSTGDWIGNLVIGDVKGLISSVGHYDHAVVEPARVINIGGATQAGAVYVYNRRRTQATTNQGCEQLVYPTALDDYIYACGPLYREIRITGGYNTIASQSTDPAVITIQTDGFAKGELGASCEAIPMHHTEQPPSGRATLDGGLRCDEVIRSINGIGGPDIGIILGKGTSVTTDPDNNQITIGLSEADLNTCEPSGSTIGVASVSNELRVPGIPGDAGRLTPGLGYATWEWDSTESDWRIVSPCRENAWSVKPVGVHTVEGKSQRQRCYPDPLNMPHGIRNGDFTGEDPLQYWNVVGDTKVLQTHPGLDANDLPVLRLTGRIYQRNIYASSHTDDSLLHIEIIDESASARIILVEDTGRALVDKVISSPYGSLTRLTFGPFRPGGTAMTFIVDAPNKIYLARPMLVPYVR